jgi:hypothetical protein
MELGKIFTHGNLVDINVSMWTAQKRLQADDLGLESDGVSSAFTLGRKMLIPAEVIAELRSLENKARHILIDHSFTFTFGGARFVPKKRFMEFVTAIDKIIILFDKKADELAANYLQYRQDMRQEYVAAAHEAYTRAFALSKGIAIEETQFLNEFIQRIEEAYPEASEIRGKFHMEYNVFQVALPDLTQASYEDLVDEGNKVKMLEETYRKTLYNKVNSFVDSITNELRGKATVVLTRLSESLAANKKINEASLASVKNMIEEYEKMDFVGDKTFLDHLKMFRIKCIDCYPAKTILNDKVVRSTVQRELKQILEAATNKSAIAELAQRYRMGIGLDR